MTIGRFLAGLAFALVFAHSAHATEPRTPSERIAEGYRLRMVVIDELLKRGEWKAARKKSDVLVRDLTQEVTGGAGAARVLAMGVLYRGIARAGEGDRDGALWDWYEAMSLEPKFRTVDLAPYGEPGKTFAEYRLKEAFERPEPALRQNLSNPQESPPPGVTAPRCKRCDPPTYPEGLRRTCQEGVIVVDVLIERDGRPTFPIVREVPALPVFLLATLETLRDWKFKPAEKDGEPVLVSYVLSVNYKTEGCNPPRKR